MHVCVGNTCIRDTQESRLRFTLVKNDGFYHGCQTDIISMQNQISNYKMTDFSDNLI